MQLRRHEIARKALHLVALLMPVGMFYLPRFSVPRAACTAILATLLVVSLGVEWVRRRSPSLQKLFSRYFRSMLREEESSRVTGATFVIMSAFLCWILFQNHLHIAFMTLFLFILGDAAAAIVGQSFGRTKIGNKSLEGSAACLAVCVLLFFGAFPFFPHLLDAWHGTVPVVIAIAASMATTLLELVPLKLTPRLALNDNLAVPVAVGALILAIERVRL